jgi:hypothetical protein
MVQFSEEIPLVEPLQTATEQQQPQERSMLVIR